MSYVRAIVRARKLAAQHNCEYYVWQESEDNYLVGDDFDADTFFAGSEPIYCTAD